MSIQIITTAFAPEEFKDMLAEYISQAVKAEFSTLSVSKDANLILTRQETANLLMISLPTLHDYTKRGIIKAHRLGNKVRYKREDVDAALKQIKTDSK